MLTAQLLWLSVANRDCRCRFAIITRSADSQVVAVVAKLGTNPTGQRDVVKRWAVPRLLRHTLRGGRPGACSAYQTRY